MNVFRLVRVCLVTSLALIAVSSVYSQSHRLDAGLRIQKSFGWYLENGISLNFSHKDYFTDRLYVGIGFVTSRLGTALGTNAIKQDQFLLSGTWMLRHDKKLRPFARINTGYFSASYEEIFDALDHSTIILAPEFGLEYPFAEKGKITTGLGYHTTAGDGINGPGTLYPIYFQITLSWALRN